MHQGIIDAHLHLIEGGLSLLNLRLYGTRSREQFEKQVQQACGEAPPPTCKPPLGFIELTHDIIKGGSLQKSVSSLLHAMGMHDELCIHACMDMHVCAHHGLHCVFDTSYISQHEA